MIVDFWNKHKLFIIIGIVIGVLAITLITIFMYPSSNDSAPPSDNTGETTNNNPADANGNMPSKLIPPTDIAAASEEDWSVYTIAMETIAMVAIQEHFAGSSIENPHLQWTQTRTNLANGANPLFNFIAIIDGQGVSVNFEMAPDNDTYILLPGSITPGIAPF
jgi:ABC-type antimicrobial peptide transport system permease subunit